jgi:hypothetical protein
MADPNDIPRRRRVLILDVTQAAEVSRLTCEAYDLNLPVEPRCQRGSRRPGSLSRAAGGRAALTLKPQQQ